MQTLRIYNLKKLKNEPSPRLKFEILMVKINCQLCAAKAEQQKTWVENVEWLFRSENCDAVAVFGLKVAAWPQGRKKTACDFVPTKRNRKALK